jgi:hypothetical protein
MRAHFFAFFILVICLSFESLHFSCRQIKVLPTHTTAFATVVLAAMNRTDSHFDSWLYLAWRQTNFSFDQNWWTPVKLRVINEYIIFTQDVWIKKIWLRLSVTYLKKIKKRETISNKLSILAWPIRLLGNTFILIIPFLTFVVRQVRRGMFKVTSVEENINENNRKTPITKMFSKLQHFVINWWKIFKLQKQSEQKLASHA